MLYCSDILSLVCLAFRDHANNKEEYTDLGIFLFPWNSFLA